MTKNSIKVFLVSGMLFILMVISFWCGTSYKVEVEKMIAAIVFLGFSATITGIYAILFNMNSK